MTSFLTYSGQIAEKSDPDRFFLTLLTGEKRTDLWPLLAFNAEIAKTREVVTDTTIGLIRLQWWRDAIDEIYQGKPVRQHEILKDLARIIHTYGLAQENFSNLIYAREFDLEDVQPSSQEGLVRYAGFTHVPLLSMMLHIIGRKEDVQPLAVAYSLTGILRGVLYHASQHRCFLPEEKMSSLSLSMLYDLKPQADLDDVVRGVAHEAWRQLDLSRPACSYTRGMKKMTQLYLKDMEKRAFNVFDPLWIESPFLLKPRAYLAGKRLIP